MIRLIGSILLVLLLGVAVVAVGGAGVGELELAVIGSIVVAICVWLVRRHVRNPHHG